ncbi:MAG TPA: radical SAM protein [Sorangium sp.]|nr:radical SAM protein [Sorangium sp.]
MFKNVITTRKAVNPPIGLATIAALTPQDWEISILDENIEPVDWNADADVVAVGGMSVQYKRQIEILDGFRRRGCYVVAGGSFASLCPERYAGYADTVIVGEAETIWPEFCADVAARRPRAVYTKKDDVALSLSPTPRHDLLKWSNYLTGSIQFSRGCPYRCEFCDIIVMFGRKPRIKSLDQIERELDALRAQDVHNVVFVDDNLIGHPAACKKLLEFLVDYQRRHRYRFVFGAEATINAADHPDILRLMREANFAWLFIGIESPDEAALKETRKLQNLRRDQLDSIKTIYSYGIDVFGGFIVGFDADDASVFERQLRFIIDAGIIIAMAGMLMAPPRTPLYERLLKVGRLKSTEVDENTLINSGLATNIVPLNMTQEELSAGVADLHRRLLDDRNIYLRLANKLSYLGPSPNYTFRPDEWAIIIFGLVSRGIIPGGPRRWMYFLRSIVVAMRRPLLFPNMVPTLVANWAYALSLRDYVDQRLRVSAPEPREPRLVPLGTAIAGEERRS